MYVATKWFGHRFVMEGGRENLPVCVDSKCGHKLVKV